jgi:hypothetical protein
MRGQPSTRPWRSIQGSAPIERSSSCSAVSKKTKKRAKWQRPAASVSVAGLLEG